jgi:hypothetical protein
MQAKELITECKSALSIISSLGKKQEQIQPVGGAAILSAHKRCCSACSSGEVKDLLSRFITH